MFLKGDAHSLIVTLFLLIATHAKLKPGKLKVMSVNSLRTIVKIIIIVILKNTHFSLPQFEKKKLWEKQTCTSLF